MTDWYIVAAAGKRFNKLEAEGKLPKYLTKNTIDFCKEMYQLSRYASAEELKQTYFKHVVYNKIEGVTK